MDNKTINMNDDEVEIDLLQLFRALKKRILWIVGAGVIMGGAFGLFSKFAITPQYTSTSMVYILSKETTLTSLADLQIGSQLTKDYKIIVTSRPVLSEVISKLKLDLTYIENYSFLLDCKLIFLTFKILFQKENTEGVEQWQVTAATKEKVQHEEQLHKKEKEN